MEILGLAVAVIALLAAVRGAGRGIRGSYQRRMAAWASSHPDANRVHHRAAALGQMAATLWYGGSALKNGWKTGWREGWASGKEWADRHRPVPVIVDPAPAEVAPTKPSPQPHPAAQPGGEQSQRRPDGRPNLRPVPNTDPTPTPAKGTRRRSTEMPIDTATGGEVTSPETLVAELTAIAREAAADMEDASGDAQRAKEDLGRIERMVASVTRLKLPAADIAVIQGLADPAAARAQAAGDRAAAAEKRLTQAQAALAMASRHVQLQGQAAGEFYGNGN